MNQLSFLFLFLTSIHTLGFSINNTEKPTYFDNFSKTEKHLDSLLSVSSGKKDSNRIAEQYYLMAIKLQHLNDFMNAVRLVRKAGHIYQKTNNGYMAFYASTVENNFLRRSNRLFESLKAIHEAFILAEKYSIREKYPSAYYFAFIQSANTKIGLFEYDQALEDLHTAYRYFVTSPMYHQTVLIYLLKSEIFQATGNVFLSKTFADSAITTGAKIKNQLIRNDRIYAGYSQLAELALQNNDVSEAIKLYIISYQYKKFFPGMADILLCQLGDAYILNNNYEKAEQSFKDALKYSSLNWNVFSGMAQVAEVRGDTLTARRYHDKAIELAERWSSYQQGVAMASFIEQVHPVYKKAARFYARQGEHERAWKTVEMVKARYLSYLTEQGTLRTQKNIPSVFIDSLAYTERRINLWYQDYISGRQKTERHFEIYNLESEKDRYLDSIRKQLPDYYHLRKPGIAAISDLLDQTAGRYQILEYALLKDSLIGIVIKDGQILSRVAASDYHELKDRITRVVASQAPKPDDLRQLYRQVFEPFEPMLDAGRELVIIPDDALFYLPFEMLLCTNNPDSCNNYLLKKYPVTYAISATAFLKQCAMISPAPRNYLGLASSDFINQEPLPYAIQQTKSAAAVFSEADIHTDQRRHKARLLSDGGQYKIIDIATHVRITDAEPMCSRILFYDTPDSTGFERMTDTNQNLYAYEFFQQSLPADLMVLSGCESGRGRLSSGEGFIGFYHALTYAGTASAVLSLWPADDQSTCELMRLFYRRLEQGESRTRALQQAKIDFLETAPELKRSPHYWAAFTLWGNPDKMFLSKNYTTFYLAASLAALLIISLILSFVKKHSARHQS